MVKESLSGSTVGVGLGVGVLVTVGVGVDVAVGDGVAVAVAVAVAVDVGVTVAVGVNVGVAVAVGVGVARQIERGQTPSAASQADKRQAMAMITASKTPEYQRIRRRYMTSPLGAIIPGLWHSSRDAENAVHVIGVRIATGPVQSANSVILSRAKNLIEAQTRCFTSFSMT